MADILEQIVAHKRQEVERFKQELSQIYLESRAEIQKGNKVPSMAAALKESTTGIIAEFKRRSPSKGWINKDALPEVVPLSYQENGAAALSILTDSNFFGGSNSYILTAQRAGIRLPVLYKNFIIDEYQIYQAKVSNASAILLIAACLTKEQCKAFIDKAHSLKLEVLLEMHTEEETEYASLGPDMCGINNRNLGTFITDVHNSFRLAELLPKEAVKVSESGISNPETVKTLRQAGFRGFLIGETFMKTPAPGLALRDFITHLTH